MVVSSATEADFLSALMVLERHETGARVQFGIRDGLLVPGAPPSKLFAEVVDTFTW